MSNETQKPTVASVPADAAQVVTEAAPKIGFLSRTKQFVKDHKRPAIAVGALVGLVAAAAYVGRKTETTHDFQYTLELESSSDDETVDQESADTTVA